MQEQNNKAKKEVKKQASTEKVTGNETAISMKTEATSRINKVLERFKSTILKTFKETQNTNGLIEKIVENSYGNYRNMANQLELVLMDSIHQKEAVASCLLVEDYRLKVNLKKIYQSKKSPEKKVSVERI